jgi:LDH2 family malate/lactate/ureidoglycolate dehydrogenase
MDNQVQVLQVQRDEMVSLSSQILLSLGTSEEDALSVADSLVQAQEAGHASHGIIRLIEYSSFVERGWVIPTGQPTIISDRGAVALIDGQWGWGQVACKYAVDVATEKALALGTSTIAIRSCNHIGRLGEYVETLAQRNLVSLMWCNADPAVAPFGGKTRVFGTNPFAAGVPNSDQDIIIDFATAGSAEGKLRVARANGQKVPEGLIITKDGNPTSDPEEFYSGGALLPFGGHKGYCMSLLIEILGGALSGNHPSMNSSYSRGNGAVLTVINPEFFTGLNEFAMDVKEASQIIKQSPAVNPNSPVLLPGEVENAQRVKNKNTIEISTAIWQSIQNLATKVAKS